MKPRTALFGGTFDPIHTAHLEMARAAMARFHLEKVLFVPAAHPPHKAGGTMAPFEDRVRMAELACGDEARFEVSRMEEGPEQSYSIATIEKLLEAGEGPLYFLIGADAFAEIRSWYRWQDVVAAVEFIVVTRPLASWTAPEGAVVHELRGLELPVSSSDIRQRLSEGAAVAVPEPVLRYISEHGLYR